MQQSVQLELLLLPLAGHVVVAVLFGMWIKSFFSPYLAKKAENLATHEDIMKLVDQVRETERVKSDIADRMWDRQAKWKEKKESAEELIDMMTGLSHLFQDFSHLPIDATLTIGHLKIMDAVKQQHDDFVRQCNCALLFLSAPAHDALNAAKLSLLGVLNHYHRKTEGDIASKLHLYNETIIRFIGCIKTDLDL